jgi:transposase
VGDREGALEMISLNLDSLSCVEKFLVDGGYTGDDFALEIFRLCGAEVEVVKRSELHTFVVLPLRWIVERTFGWLDKCRRLWKNCEKKLHNSLQMTIFALAAVLLKRF